MKLKITLIIFIVFSVVLSVVSVFGYLKLNTEIKSRDELLDEFYYEMDVKISQLDEAQLLNEAYENDLLITNSEIEFLNESLLQINADYQKLSDELLALKVTPGKLLQQMKLHFENKEYDLAITVGNEIHLTYLNSTEDKEAQVLLVKVKAENDKKKAAEQVVNISAEIKKIKDKVSNIIEISNFEMTQADTKGAIGVRINFTNKSTKIIKYAKFDVQFFNAVDDPINCTVNKTSTRTLSATGPYNQNEGNFHLGYWNSLFTNNQVHRVKLMKIHIDYMDGTSTDITDSELQFLFMYNY